MSSDIEFLQKRLALVAQVLAQPDANQACRSVRQSDLRRRNIAYRREARLLQKLLVWARPGSVLDALMAWRQTLGRFAKEYRTKHKKIIRAYDEWSELPPHIRGRIAAPPKPPAPRLCDRDGAPWIVDDGLLLIVDDLIERLQKWLKEDT